MLLESGDPKSQGKRITRSTGLYLLECSGSNYEYPLSKMLLIWLYLILSSGMSAIDLRGVLSDLMKGSLLPLQIQMVSDFCTFFITVLTSFLLRENCETELTRSTAFLCLRNSFFIYQIIKLAHLSRSRHKSRSVQLQIKCQCGHQFLESSQIQSQQDQDHFKSGQEPENDQEMLFLQQENKALKGLLQTRMKELKDKDDMIEQLRIEKETDAKENERLKLEIVCYKSTGTTKNTQLEPILVKLNLEKKELKEQNRKLSLQLKQKQNGLKHAHEPMLEKEEFRQLLKEYSELQNYTQNGELNYRTEQENLIQQLKFFKKVADQSVRQLMMTQDLLNEERADLKEEMKQKEKALAEQEARIKELGENIETKYPGVLEYLEDKRAIEENTELASRDEKEQAIFNEQLSTLRKEEDDVFFKEFTDKEYSTPSKKNDSKGSLQGTQEAPLSNLQHLFSSLTSSMVKPASYKKALSNQKLEEEIKQITSQPQEGWGKDVELNMQDSQKYAFTEPLSIDEGWSEETDSKKFQETAPIELDLDEEWI